MANRKPIRWDVPLGGESYMGLAQYFLTHEENMRQAFSQPSRRARRTLPDGTTIDYIMNDVVDFIRVRRPQRLQQQENAASSSSKGKASYYALTLTDYYSDWYGNFLGYGLLSDEFEITDGTKNLCPYCILQESFLSRTGSLFRVKIGEDMYVTGISPLTHPDCTTVMPQHYAAWPEASDIGKYWLPKDVTAIYYRKKFEHEAFGTWYYAAKQALTVGELNITQEALRDQEGFFLGDKTDEAPFMSLFEPFSHDTDTYNYEIIDGDAWYEDGYAGVGETGYFVYGYHIQSETEDVTNRLIFARGFDYGLGSFVIFSLSSYSSEKGYIWEGFGLPPDYPLGSSTTYHHEWERTATVSTAYLWDGLTLREIGYSVSTYTNEYDDVEYPSGILHGTRTISETVNSYGYLSIEPNQISMLDDNELAYYWSQAQYQKENVVVTTYYRPGFSQPRIIDEEVVTDTELTSSPEIVMGIRNLTTTKEVALPVKLLTNDYCYTSTPLSARSGRPADFQFILEITDEPEIISYAGLPSSFTEPGWNFYWHLQITEPPTREIREPSLVQYTPYRGLFFRLNLINTMPYQNKCLVKLHRIQ